MNQRELFLRHLAQTSTAPLALEIVRAEGCQLFDRSGKSYIDLIGGISVANTGHRHPAVLSAIRQQLDAYLHIMVYGEFIQSPQVQYATLLASLMPDTLNAVYFTNSGAEAVEGAMKLAKRATNRSKIIACNRSYHGSTQGALSIIGDEYWRNSYRPLLPGIYHLDYNSPELIDAIDTATACVILETVQAEAGVMASDPAWIQEVARKCRKTGCLLILDEIQTGFGRTGRLWGFENFDVVPDILLLGKALGGGMPLGAFIAERSLMMQLTDQPVLGHITTFGGHPVSCAAGMASLKSLLAEQLSQQVSRKEALFLSLLQHEKIVAVRSYGLLIAVEFDSFETNKLVIDGTIGAGAITDWFLFASNCLRICPPLTISEEEIITACRMILQQLSQD
ncbi:aspartate aminotransferase family protein [Niabella terrae]